MTIATIGIDIAKNVFQIHGVCADGKLLVSRQLRRGQVLPYLQKLAPCLIGLEACPGAHHWARQIAALGHDVRLMPPQYVKPYVKRQKNDAADAAAICEAVSRPTMRFVAIKSEEQQSVLMLHRTRELLIRQKTMLINALRAQLSEFGIKAPGGRTGLTDLVAHVEGAANRLPGLARAATLLLIGQLKEAMGRLTVLDRQIVAWHRACKASLRLKTIMGVGAITASVIVASVIDGRQFQNGRQFAAWLGLVPLQTSTRGKARLGRITKWGDSCIRKLLVVSSRALIRYARGKSTPENWLANVLARRPAKVAAVAMANKTARITGRC
ncbi:IS110 family transposase [Sphingomonas sp. DBB INV C78]